ncbi:acyltransferase [Convivina intestini]|uniref:acyltransferase n=1 Tax=Convivina intestini TaxID=1505726 RepID=UPI00200EF93D|nr:acyltransferase [Convivina intestini]CAH1850305.1 hypothetical protein R078131_00063 [Convivina intestini]
MKRYYYMDVLNIFSALAVVFLHSSEFAFTNNTGESWFLATFIQCLFIWAVPVFFMLSGANILDYRQREGTKVFLQKRMRKIITPFLVWSLVWFVIKFRDFSFLQIETYGNFINGLVHGTIQPIFWFFYLIIGFYISAPLVSKITNVANKQLVQYLLVVNFIFVEIWGYYCHLMNQPESALTSGLSIGATGSIGYFIVGWYLKNYSLTTNQKRIIYIGGFISLILMYGLCCFLSLQRGNFQREAYDIWGVFGFIWSISIFLLFQQRLIDWVPTARVQYLLKKIASTSLGVYVLHEFFILIFEKYLHLSSSSWVHMLIMPIFIWLFSVIVVILMQAIPYVKRLV